MLLQQLKSPNPLTEESGITSTDSNHKHRSQTQVTNNIREIINLLQKQSRIKNGTLKNPIMKNYIKLTKQ